METVLILLLLGIFPFAPLVLSLMAFSRARRAESRVEALSRLVDSKGRTSAAVPSGAPSFGVTLNIVSLLAGIVLLASACFADEPDLRSKFAWRQEISGGGETGVLYRIRVPRDVFDGCRVFPSDLRILDDAGRQWPLFVFLPEGKTITETVPAKTVNTSLVEKNSG